MSLFWQEDRHGAEWRRDDVDTMSPEIKTQLSFHTQKNDFLSAIRHFNWWVRVLKMVVTAAGWWDEDNERWSCVWGPALAILTNQDSCHISQDSSGKLGAKDKDWLMSDGKRSSQICEVVTWLGGLTLLKFDNKKYHHHYENGYNEGHWWF